MLEIRNAISSHVIDPENFAKILKIIQELGLDEIGFMQRLPHNLEVVFDLIKDYEHQTIQFVMKAHSKVEQLSIVEQHLVPTDIYEPLKWWHKILRFLHIPFRLKVIDTEPVIQTMTLPEDMVTAILFQIHYWNQQNVEPSKLLISRDCYNELRDHPDAWEFFTMGVPSSGNVMRAFGLEIVCDSFLEGNVYLVC